MMSKNAHKCSAKFVQKIEQIFQKSLDKSEQVFYNIKQNKRAEQMYTRYERILITMTSNAKRITAANRNITMTTRVKSARKSELMLQKLVGAAMLIFVALSLSVGGYFVAALVIAPFALAAVFSKEKVLDFGIFSDDTKSY